MEITKKSTAVETTYEVRGAEPIQARYRQSHIIPDQIVVTFVDGQWSFVAVYGPVAKKDGSPSQNHSKTNFQRGFDESAMPDWLRGLTEDVG